MRKITQLSIHGLSLVVIWFCLGSDMAVAKSFDLRFEPNTISADLRQVPLVEVLDEIGSKQPFWYRGDPSALEEKISVRFQHLPIQDALRRILAKTNFSLIANETGQIIGAIILGPKTSGPATTAHKDQMPGGSLSYGDLFRAQDEPQDSADPAVIVVASQVEMLAEIAIQPDANYGIAPTVLPGVPAEFVELLSNAKR